MFFIKQKLFIQWLIYVAIIVCVFAGSIISNLLPLGLMLDKSYLTDIILAFYFLSEIYLGYLLIRLSNDVTQINRIIKFLDSQKDLMFRIIDGETVISAEGRKFKIRNKTLNDHIKNLILRAQHWTGKKPRLDQTVLINSLGERLYDRIGYVQLASNVVIIMGLIGTVFGIIVTFWPFMDPNATIDLTKIQSQLGLVFSGVGSAFIPSVVAAMVGVALLFNERMLNTGITELINQITNISETHVIPVLERRTDETQTEE